MSIESADNRRMAVVRAFDRAERQQDWSLQTVGRDYGGAYCIRAEKGTEWLTSNVYVEPEQ